MKVNHSRLIAILFFFFSGIGTIMCQLPKGVNLLTNGFSSFKSFGTDSEKQLTSEVIVEGQSFWKAIRIDTNNKLTGNRLNGIQSEIDSNFQKGDVLWISFKARCISTKRENGEGYIELKFDNLINGVSSWPAHLVRGVSVGNKWVETSIPFVMRKNASSNDVKFVIKFDTYEQIVEIGPITFINYGQHVNVNDLPRTVIKYEGDEPNAQWRKDALARIEKIRKGQISIKVVNAKGKNIEQANVSIQMKRSAFNWGTAINSSTILDNKSKDAQIFRDTLLKYFNQVVYENELKSGRWASQPAQTRGSQTKICNEWLRKNGIGIRAHVMVWPSWKLSSNLVPYKNDTSLLRSKIFEHIQDQTAKLKGEFDQWDVVNEPITNYEILDLLGKSEMISWFKAARIGDPNVKLYLNDFTMFQGKGNGSNSQKFYDNIKMLVDGGAPIDGIGEQGHIGETAPGIPFVLERLDYFGKFNLPIQITEFDIRSNDEEYKANYMRDFLIAVYSHPATIGFVQWGFWAGSHWFPEAALWDNTWKIRKAGFVYAEMVNKTWKTNFTALTNKDGMVMTKGYCGDYEIVVKYKNKTISQKIKLDNSGKEIVIKL